MDEPKQVEFRDIPGYPGYRVGDDGRVWSCWKMMGHQPKVIADAWWLVGHTLRPDGRIMVSLANSGFGDSRSGRLVHQLVLEAFIGPCPEGMECRHLNGIPTDNRLDNLAWGTHEENHQDKVRHGTSPRGEKNVAAKLTNDQAEEIRRRYANGERQPVLAAEFGVCQPKISRIVNHRSYR